jgi:DNA-binding beta-propeller fold protein YncE
VPFSSRGFIPIPRGRNPGFDHADVYRASPGASRLYVAHTGADRVDVIDCATNTYLRAIEDLPGVAGVLIDQQQHLLLTSDRTCGRVSLFNAPDDSLIGRIDVGLHPNGVAYDSTRRHLFSFNLGEPIGTDCSASVVALDEMAVVSTIALPGRPRWAVYDGATDRVYANIREPAQVVVLSAGELRIVGAYDVPSAGPHGLALVGDRLFCAADGRKLVELHRDTGEVLGCVDLAGEPDVIMTDDDGKRLFVAVGIPGVIEVIDETTLAKIETVWTEPGAHTIAWDPDGRALYAFLPNKSGALALADGPVHP